MGATQFLKTLSETASVDLSGLISFLKKRISNAEAIHEGESDLSKEEALMLNYDFYVRLRQNQLDDPNTRLAARYIELANVNFGHALRRKAGRRIGEVREFEKPYQNELKLVSDREFHEELNRQMSKDELFLLLFQCSQDLANAIFERMPAHN